jgi:hypothetical protein
MGGRPRRTGRRPLSGFWGCRTLANSRPKARVRGKTSNPTAFASAFGAQPLRYLFSESVKKRRKIPPEAIVIDDRSFPRKTFSPVVAAPAFMLSSSRTRCGPRYRRSRFSKDPFSSAVGAPAFMRGSAGFSPRETSPQIISGFSRGAGRRLSQHGQASAFRFLGCVAKRQTPPPPPSVRNHSAICSEHRSNQLPIGWATVAHPRWRLPPPTARVRHPQLPHRQTQRPINFTVNCRSGIVLLDDASRMAKGNREACLAKGCATRQWVTPGNQFSVDQNGNVQQIPTPASGCSDNVTAALVLVGHYGFVIGTMAQFGVVSAPLGWAAWGIGADGWAGAWYCL